MAIGNQIISEYDTKPGIDSEILIHSDDIPRKIISIKETAPAITGLRDSELTKLINLPIKENTDRWHVRNTFLFAMYEGGIRIGDVIQLRCPNLPGNV